jgi:hypothetical protein
MLLRTRRERPCDSRAAKQRDELASLHILSQAQATGILTPQTSVLIEAEIGCKPLPQCTANVADGSKAEYRPNARMSASTGSGHGCALARGRLVPILLQKSFCTRDQNFFWLYTRNSCKDVGDLIA